MKARLKRRNPGVSLFPFLSVLAVVIGTLTLIITGISLGEITKDTLPRAGQPLAASIGEGLSSRDSPAAATSPAEREITAKDSLELLRRTIAEKEAELAAVRKRRGGAAEEGAPAFQGSGRAKAPSFVECRADGLLLDAQAEKSRQTLVAREEIGTSASLASFLAGVKAREGGSAVFVIRPGGVTCFDRARRTIRESGATCGYMAAPDPSELDYRHYGTE